ncbi:MAG: acyl carrier protein [Alphaproteobacteria bacterium]|nr:acyl carrier protein [Alphaproteobacteria bacterium]
MTELENQLRDMMISVLNLEDVSADDIGVEDDLFSEDGLALDSIDALELGVAIQKRYGVKLDGDEENLANHFQNLRVLAALVEARQTKQAAQND